MSVHYNDFRGQNSAFNCHGNIKYNRSVLVSFIVLKFLHIFTHKHTDAHIHVHTHARDGLSIKRGVFVSIKTKKKSILTKCNKVYETFNFLYLYKLYK